MYVYVYSLITPAIVSAQILASHWATVYKFSVSMMYVYFPAPPAPAYGPDPH